MANQKVNVYVYVPVRVTFETDGDHIWVEDILHPNQDDVYNEVDIKMAGRFGDAVNKVRPNESNLLCELDGWKIYKRD